jgi:hypothetical protein
MLELEIWLRVSSDDLGWLGCCQPSIRRILVFDYDLWLQF